MYCWLNSAQHCSCTVLNLYIEDWSRSCLYISIEQRSLLLLDILVIVTCDQDQKHKFLLQKVCGSVLHLHNRFLKFKQEPDLLKIKNGCKLCSYISGNCNYMAIISDKDKLLSQGKILIQQHLQKHCEYLRPCKDGKSQRSFVICKLGYCYCYYQQMGNRGRKLMLCPKHFIACHQQKQDLI